MNEDQLDALEIAAHVCTFALACLGAAVAGLGLAAILIRIFG